MNPDEMRDVIRHIISAYQRVARRNLPGNRNRSKEFVRTMCLALRRLFDIDTRVQGPDPIERTAVLARGVPNPIHCLRTSEEYLFDLHAFKYVLLRSRNARGHHCHVVGSVIQLESEFNDKDLNAVMTDFNKLVAGRADMKVMIMSRPTNQQYPFHVEMIKGLSLNHGREEEVFLIMLPHPRGWDGPQEYDVLRLRIGPDPDDFGWIPYPIN